MNPLGKLAAALVATILITTTSAPAQDAPFGGGGWFLLTNRSVQDELKLTDQQTRDFEAFAAVSREQFAAKVRTLTAEQRPDKIRVFMMESDEALHDGLVQILKPEQIVRFDEVALQAAGLQAFSVSRVRSVLKLTGDQDAKLRQIDDDLRKSMQGLRDELRNDRVAALDRMTARRRRALDAAVGLLTPEQKATWTGLIGEPFELKLDPPGRQRD